MEVDGQASTPPPPPQREVPKEKKQESTMVDETTIPVRQALVEEIQDWSGMNREDAISGLMSLLKAANLPIPCPDIELGQILLWARSCRERGVDWEDSFSLEFDRLKEILTPYDPEESDSAEEESEDNIDF